MKQRKPGCYIAAVLLAGLMLGGCGNPNAKANTAESVSASDPETVSESEEIVSAEAETENGFETETEIETETDPIVIVLDPGHDSEYCTRNHPDLGVNEQDCDRILSILDPEADWKGTEHGFPFHEEVSIFVTDVNDYVKVNA